MFTTISILIVILFSSFFSSTETAFFSISQAKLNSLAKKSKRGKILQDLKENKTDSFISTIVCGNNIVNIVGTMLVTLIAAQEFGENKLAFISIMFTFAIIMFAEVIPKNIGEKFSTPLLMKTVYIIKFLMIVLKPIVVIINAATKLANKFLPDQEDNKVNEEEVIETMKISVKDGEMNHEFYDKFKKILTLDDKKVSCIMTPAEEMTHVAMGSTLDNSAYQFKHSQHSRIFVTDENIHNVKGYVLQKTMIQMLADNNNDLVDRFIIEPTFIHKDTILIDAVKILMQSAPSNNNKSQRYIAVVQDDDGSTLGVVTLEDVIEEVFGEIIDETDAVV